MVLKGFVGVIYGSGNLGGIINYVIKKFKFISEYSIEVEVGNDDFFSGVLESIGILSELFDNYVYCVGIYCDIEKLFCVNISSDNIIVDFGYMWFINSVIELIM